MLHILAVLVSFICLHWEAPPGLVKLAGFFFMEGLPLYQLNLKAKPLAIKHLHTYECIILKKMAAAILYNT